MATPINLDNLGKLGNLDVQGHRGCRGLFPENSIPGFLHALDLGVTTLELDVVITKDNQVVLSHEPWFSHHFCLDPSGNKISKAQEKENNIYEMTLEEVQQFDCGSIVHPIYPDQQKLKTYKPTLAEVIDEVEAHLKKKNLPAVDYNIETKSTVERTNIFHPEPLAFVDKVMAVIKDKGIEEKTIIQSFDTRTLKVMNKSFPKIRTALLIEDNKNFRQALDELGFKPTIYSPAHKLVNTELIEHLRKENILLIPWTINKQKRMQELIDMGVDGLITDYPDRLLELVKK